MSMDLYLQLDGIRGDSVSRGHERWIELDSVAWGVTHAAGASSSGVGAATGRASFAPLQATGAMGSATPPLFLACASGTRIQEAVLEAVSVGAEPGVLARWELENVRVSALTIAGATSAEAMSDALSLAYGRVTYTTFPTDRRGQPGAGVTATWDIQGGRR